MGHGFTLVALLITISIILTIAALAIPNLLSAMNQARIAKAVGDIHALGTDIRGFELINRAYPNTLADIGYGNTTEEMQVMKDHVRCGVRILEPIHSFRETLPIVAQHHEWFNGKGYPEGLAGEEISLYTRIFAVADCYDALKSDRPYRKGMSKQQTLAILKSKSGLQFDPNVIDALLRRMGDKESEQPAFAAKMGGPR